MHMIIIILCNDNNVLKTMCPPGYHHSGFMATHALRHMMYYAYLAIVRFEHSVCR